MTSPSKDTVRVEHTPTPWKIEDPGVGCNFLEIVGSDASVISEVGMWTPKAKQNAAFIVRAVNAHDSAARSLQIAIEHIEHMAAFIAKQDAGYSFESLGEDMPGIRATLSRLKSEG